MIHVHLLPTVPVIFLLTVILVVLLLLLRRHLHRPFPTRAIIQQTYYPVPYVGSSRYPNPGRRKGDIQMAVTGVKQGATGTFQIVPTAPPNAAFPPSTQYTWSVDDTANVTLTPSADGTQVAAAVSATDPNASFNLTVRAVSPDGTQSVGTSVSVPVITVTPPPPPFPTSVDINQLS